MSAGAAGVTFGDYDGDGRPDLYLSTHQSYLNDTDYMAKTVCSGMPAIAL